METNVIVLDEHQPEDARVGRHIAYLLRHTVQVYRLHFGIFAPGLPGGRFSLYGEKGYRIRPPFVARRLPNVLAFNTMYLLPILFAPFVGKALDDLGVDRTAPTVLHVHDPGLLRVATMMKRLFLRDARVVYDRHEFFEVFYKKTRLPLPTIHRMYEIIARDGIDGVAHASVGHNPRIGALFPRAAWTQAPNYPLGDSYDDAAIAAKVRSFGPGSPMNLLYVGSLNTHDRDVRLMLEIAGDVLERLPTATFFIGGPSYGHDDELLRLMLPLRERFGQRFRFHLGYVPRETTMQLTEASHAGLLFIRPETSYWITSSPNKVFEYLRCGAIPLVRASFESSESVAPCSLVFDRHTPDGEVVAEVGRLLRDTGRCRAMMETALALGTRYTFETVGPRYLALYERIRAAPPAR